MHKKAQAVITDLFIALMIFTILISAIAFVWGRYSMRFNDNLEYSGMQLKALEISDLLIKTRGSPENWELSPSDAEIFGLASSDRTISEEKLDSLTHNVTYNNMTASLGLSDYGLYLRLSSLNGTSISDYGLDSESQLSVSIKRFVNYKNETSVFETRIWK